LNHILARLAGLVVPAGAAIPGGLKGSYDIQGDIITGAVVGIPFTSPAGMRVEAVRNGSVIASCGTGTPGRDGLLPFNMPMAGRFTAREIVCDAVTLTARSARGDTGLLKLNGATQLGLIREHLGASVEILFDLDFSRDGNASGFLGRGWSSPQARATWMIDDESEIRFDSPAAAGSYALRMKFEAFVTPLVPIQLLDIYANGALVAALTTNDGRTCFRELPLDAPPFAAAAATTLRLYHPYAARPSDFSLTADTRRLSFGVHRLTLVRLLEGE
jgi:hypothetical protein